MNDRHKRVSLALSTSFTLAGLLSLAGAAVRQDRQAAPKLGSRDKAFQVALRDAHNKARAKEGKPPLEISPWLAQAAMLHAKDMAARHEMSHTGSDKSTPEERVRRIGYRFINTGENVAAGQRTIAEVMTGWMGSEGHRANILGDFTQIGGARVVDSEGINYWTVEFGTPVPEIEPEKAAAAFVESLNAMRKERDLEPVSVSPELHKVAESTAARVAQAEKPPGTIDSQDLYQRVKDAGYNYKMINLSIASGQYTGKELVDGLAKSPSADKTIFGPHQHVGVGVSVDHDGHPHWVVLLGSPLEDGTAPEKARR